MPTINKIPRKPKSTNHTDTDMRKLRQSAYTSTQWRKVRDTYLKNHPVCEECLKEGKVNAGTLDEPLHVHHRSSPFTGGKINYELLLDDNNLETICPYHHAMEHQAQKGVNSPEKIIAILDELLLDDNWDDDDNTDGD